MAKLVSFFLFMKFYLQSSFKMLLKYMFSFFKGKPNQTNSVSHLKVGSMRVEDVFGLTSTPRGRKADSVKTQLKEKRDKSL